MLSDKFIKCRLYYLQFVMFFICQSAENEEIYRRSSLSLLVCRLSRRWWREKDSRHLLIKSTTSNGVVKSDAEDIVKQLSRLETSGNH